MTVLGMLSYLVLITVYHLMLIMEALVHQEKKCSVNFSKVMTKFSFSLRFMMIIIIYLLMEKKLISLKPTMKMLTFKLNFG